MFSGTARTCPPRRNPHTHGYAATTGAGLACLVLMALSSHYTCLSGKQNTPRHVPCKGVIPGAGRAWACSPWQDAYGWLVVTVCPLSNGSGPVRLPHRASFTTYTEP